MTPIGKYQFNVPQLTDVPDVPSHLTSLATQIDNLLSGVTPGLGIASTVLIGDPATTTDSMLQITKVAGGVVLLNRHRVFPTGSGGGQGTIAASEIYENGAEVASLNYRRDGQLFAKSGGPAGISRPVPFAIQCGYVDISVDGVVTGTAVVNFAAGRFTATDAGPPTGPIVTVACTNSLWHAGVSGTNISNASVTLYARNNAGTPGASGGKVGVYWTAVQMSATVRNA